MYKRGNRKLIADYKTEDCYKFYKNKYKNVKYVDRSTYSRILREFYNEVMRLIIYENMDFIMPAKLGTLRVKKKPISPKIDEDGNLDLRTLSVNWKKTNNLWRQQYPDKTPEEIRDIPDKHLIRELNEHSDGYRYLWYWDRVISNVKNQSCYKIDITRTHDRELAKAVKTVSNLQYYD